MEATSREGAPGGKHQAMAEARSQPPSEHLPPELHLLLPEDKLNPPLWKSLWQQIQEWRHPEKLPPLKLTSKPVPVRELWGFYDYSRRGALGSVLLHVGVVAALVATSVIGARMVKQVQQQQVVALIAPDISE